MAREMNDAQRREEEQRRKNQEARRKEEGAPKQGSNPNWVNPRNISRRERQDRYLERNGLLNYQTQGLSAQEIASRYANANVRIADNSNWFKDNYGTPQYAQPQVEINIPQPNEAVGNAIPRAAMSPDERQEAKFNYVPASNGLVIKEKYNTVWLNGDPNAAPIAYPNAPIFASIEDAKSGQANWTDVETSERQKLLSDPNFYKNNEITKYEPWMQQQILADPNFDWDKLPKWQKFYYELSSSPAGMGAVQGGVMGAVGGPVGGTVGAVLGAGLGWAAAKSGYDTTKEFWEQDSLISGGFGFMNFLAEQAEKTIGMGFQIANAATDPNKQAADLLNKESWNAGASFFEVITPAYIDSMNDGKGELGWDDLLKIAPSIWVTAKIGELILNPEKNKGEELYLGANAPMQLDKNWVERIDQAREEIKAGRPYREVMMDMQTGVVAQMGDMAGQAIADPLNVLPRMESGIGAKIAEAGGNKVAETAFRQSEGLTEAARRYKTLVQTGQALTIDPNFKVDQMGAFSRYVAGINDQGQVKAGGLLPTKTGLLDPVNVDKTGWVKSMIESDPHTRAQTGANMFYENVSALLTTFDDPHEAVRYLKALANNDMETWAQLGSRFAESPEFYTVLPALKEFNTGKLDAIVAQWDLSLNNRDALTRISGILGEEPAKWLEDTAKRGTYEQDFQRLKERVSGMNTPEARAILKDIEAGVINPEFLKQTVDLFTGEGALPWHPGQWKAMAIVAMGKHFDEWVTKRLMLDKSPEAVNAFYRTTALMKQVQSILLLGGSPGYAITNGLSNMVNLAMTGLYGLMTPKQVGTWLDRLEITPARFEEGVGIGGNVEGMVGRTKVKTEAITKAVKGKGPLTTAKENLAKLSRGMPMSKLSGWFEKIEGQQGFAIAMKQFWSQSWRRGVGFSKMSPDMVNTIKGMGIAPERIYAAIEAGMNQTEIEKALFGRFEGVQARSLINDAAQKTGLSAAQAADMLEKVGVLDTLDTYLRGQTSKEGIQAAFNKANRIAQDYIDMQTGDDLKAIAESVKQRVGVEGAAAALDVVQKAQATYTDAWLDHYFRFGEVMNDLKLLDDPAQRSRAIDFNYEVSDGEFRRVTARNAANYKGIFEAWGMSNNPAAMNVLAAIGESDMAMSNAYRLMREIRKGFFDKYRNDWDNVDWDEWDANNRKIDSIFKQAFAEKKKAEIKQAAALGNIYESLYGPAAGEAARNWWEDVVAFNDEMVTREQEFRASLADMDKDQRAAAKQQYYSETKRDMIVEMDRINAEGIARLERVIKRGGGQQAEGGRQTPPPTPPEAGTVPNETPQAGTDAARVQQVAKAEANQKSAQQNRVDEFNALMAAAEGRKAADAKAIAEHVDAVWEVASEYWAKGGNYERGVLGAGRDKFALMGALRKAEYGGLPDLKGIEDPRLTPEIVRQVLENRKVAKEAAGAEAASAAVSDQPLAKKWDVSQINEDTSLLRAISLHGGIDLKIAKDLTGESRPKSAPGVFTKKGVNIDEMARMLADDGYPIDLNRADDPGGIIQATELISRARAGMAVYPVGHDFNADAARAEAAYYDGYENVDALYPPADPALWQTEFTEAVTQGDLTKIWGMIGDYPETFDPAALDGYIRMADETAARVESEGRDLEVAQHMARAEEAIATAEARAEAVTTRQLLKEKFADAFGLDETQAQAYMELSDAVIGHFAKITGESADSLYSRYYADVVKVEGEQNAGGRTVDSEQTDPLFQRGQLYRADVYQIDRVRSEYNATKRTDWITQAVDEFGTTINPEEAGYILPDGKMLDLSGKRDGGLPGKRGYDHREIGRILPDSVSPDGSATQYMLGFASETGSVRFSVIGSEVFVNMIGSVPTDAQIRAIKKALKGYENVTFDIADTHGNVLLSGDYPARGGSIDKIAGEARRLFEGTESGESLQSNYDALFQGRSASPKGAVTFDAEGIKATIHAFESGDLSTLIHENGHVFRRMLADVAERTNNPYIKADLATIEDWAGVKDGQWNRAAEEKFARGFEKYITDGKAPTPALVKAFEGFKKWMLEIYKTITGSAIDVKLSDDVRRVFDRMLGAENLKIDMDAMLLQMNYDPKIYYVSPLGIPTLKAENFLEGDSLAFEALKAKAEALKARMRSGEVQPNPSPSTALRSAQDGGMQSEHYIAGNEGGPFYPNTRYGSDVPVPHENVQALSQWTNERVQANLERMRAQRPSTAGLPSAQDGGMLFQDANQPFGAYDAASGFHPQSEVQEQGWAQHVRPLMDAMQEGAINQLSDPSTALRSAQDGWTKDMSPEGQKMLRQYMKKVQGEMATTKLATVRWGEKQRDFALLNYNKRYGLDRVAETVFPYQFYMTRSMMTYAARILDKPAMFANYARLRNQQERYERDIPERLRGKIKINAPWLPEWMGGGLYIDPSNLFFPAQLLKPFERAQQDKNYQTIETERILQEWAQDGQYSQAEIAQAAQNQSGSVWERANAEAKIRRESETSNPIDFFSSMFGPAWYLATPLNLAGIKAPGIRGEPNAVSQLPLGNTSRALDTVTDGTWAEPIGNVLGLLGKFEDWGREKLNLPTRGEYGEYYTKRQVANMVAEGLITPEAASLAMIEQQGDVWEQAAQRVDMELAMRVPGAGALYGLLHEGDPRSILPSLFGAGLLPEGELEYRGMKQEWNEAWKKADAGDTGAITAFFEEHPEYEAYLAKNKDGDELLKSFLIGQIWDGYMELGDTNKKQARAEMGDLFAQSFLDKETRSYDALDVETLTMWARMLNKKVPTPQIPASAAGYLEGGNAPKLDLYSPAVTGITDQFFEQRRDMFPNYYEQQQGYYALPKSERASYLLKNPDLKKYWDWKDGWYSSYPEYKPIFNGKAFKTVDTSNWPPALEDFVRSYAYTGKRMPSGAYAALQQVWIMEGQPMGDFETWVDSQVVPAMMYQGEE